MHQKAVYRSADFVAYSSDGWAFWAIYRSVDCAWQSADCGNQEYVPTKNYLIANRCLDHYTCV